MLWASFGVLNILFRYVTRALGTVVLVLTATVASVDESFVSRVVTSTSEGRGYYYNCDANPIKKLMKPRFKIAPKTI